MDSNLSTNIVHRKQTRTQHVSHTLDGSKKKKQCLIA